MKKPFIFTSILFFSMLTSFTVFAQQNKAPINIIPSQLAGTWSMHNTDPSFNHKSSIEFTFTGFAKFGYENKMDGQVKEKYEGTFEIVNGNILELNLLQKPSKRFEIINVENGTLRIREPKAKNVLLLTKT